MMIKAYLGTLVAFLALDAVWLGVIARNSYSKWIGHLMRDSPFWPAAGAFYLLYIAGIVFLAVQPGLEAASWKTAAVRGAVLGLIAYGTYDFTNYATLKDWPFTMVLVDLVWGTFLTGMAAAAGYLVAR